jgi:hypothetical protein
MILNGSEILVVKGSDFPGITTQDIADFIGIAPVQPFSYVTSGGAQVTYNGENVTIAT